MLEERWEGSRGEKGGRDKGDMLHSGACSQDGVNTITQ